MEAAMRTWNCVWPPLVGLAFVTLCSPLPWVLIKSWIDAN